MTKLGRVVAVVAVLAGLATGQTQTTPRDPGPRSGTKHSSAALSMAMASPNSFKWKAFLMFHLAAAMAGWDRASTAQAAVLATNNQPRWAQVQRLIRKFLPPRKWGLATKSLPLFS